MPSVYSERVRRTIAANVRQRRLELGLTQADAAEQIGMATRHLQKLEAGELNVTIDTLSKVVEALDMTIIDVFRESRAKGR